MRLLFVHIPKTAGLSIARSIQKTHSLCVIDHTRILERSSDRIDRKKMSVWTKVGPAIRRYRSFAVVRHPHDRFLSAYCYLYDSDKRGCTIDQAVGAIIRSYQDVNAFIRDLPHHMERITHFLPQHVFICRDDQVVIDHVLRFEDLPDCLSVLGLDIDLCHVNRSDRRRHDLRLTPESMKILKNCYQKDFDILGYDCRSD